MATVSWTVPNETASYPHYARRSIKWMGLPQQTIEIIQVIENTLCPPTSFVPQFYCANGAKIAKNLVTTAARA
jgi:hypothetical protein